MSKWEEGTAGTRKDLKKKSREIPKLGPLEESETSPKMMAVREPGGRLRQTMWDLICMHELYYKGKGKSLKDSRRSWCHQIFETFLSL